MHITNKHASIINNPRQNYQPWKITKQVLDQNSFDNDTFTESFD